MPTDDEMYPDTVLPDGKVIPGFKKFVPESSSANTGLPELHLQELSYLLATAAEVETDDDEDECDAVTLFTATRVVNLEWLLTGKGNPAENTRSHTVADFSGGATVFDPGSSRHTSIARSAIDNISMVRAAAAHRTLYPQALLDVEGWLARLRREAVASRVGVPPKFYEDKGAVISGILIPKELRPHLPENFLVDGDNVVVVSKDHKVLVTTLNLASSANLSIVWAMLASADSTKEVTLETFTTNWTKDFTYTLQNSVDSRMSEIKRLRRQLLTAQRQLGVASSRLKLLSSSTAVMIAEQIAAIKKVDGVTGITFHPGCLRVSTCDVHAEVEGTDWYTEVEGTDWYMGKYEIDIDPNGEIWVRNLQATAKAGFRTHPHCFADGEACLGGYQTLLGTCMSTYDFAGAVRVVIDFLGNVTADDGNARDNLTKYFVKASAVETTDFVRGGRAGIGKFGEVEEEED